jgi:hypothetical protein
MSHDMTHYVMEIGGVRYEAPVAEIEALYAAVRRAPGESLDTQVLDAFGDSDLVTPGDPVEKEAAGPLAVSGESAAPGGTTPR